MNVRFDTSDLVVHRIVELYAPFKPALDALPTLTLELLDENRAWLTPDSLDSGGVFWLCYQSFIVQTPHHTILVDSCIGNHKTRPRAEYHQKSDDTYMRALAAAGISLERIDFVMCTHLHSDHVGWNTRLLNGEWVPTFPNARYIFSRGELEAMQSADALAANTVYRDSILPIVQADRAEIVEADYALGDHVRILPTPGHTKGHVTFCFGKKADDVVVTGDLIHLPLQMRYPELSFASDLNPEIAAMTRRKFLERYCDTSTLCCCSHFSSPAVGHVKRWGDGYKLVKK